MPKLEADQIDQIIRLRDVAKRKMQEIISTEDDVHAIVIICANKEDRGTRLSAVSSGGTSLGCCYRTLTQVAKSFKKHPDRRIKSDN